MKNNAVRFLSALLCLLTAASAAAACGEESSSPPPGAGSDETTSVTEAETEPPSDLEIRAMTPDDLPESDFGGRAMRILACDYAGIEFTAEEQTGDVIEDAVYARNRDVTERFNFGIEHILKPYNEVSQTLAKSVQSGDDAYDLVSNHVIEMGNCAMKGYLIDWGGLPHVDVSKPWWNSSSFENLSVHDRAFLLVGSLNTHFLKTTYCVYFNKRLVDNYGFGNMYRLVWDGKWTIDRQGEMISGTWQDLNGNSKADVEDFFGASSNSTSYATTYIYSSGLTTVSKDGEGIPVLDMDQDKFALLTEKVYKLFYENGSFYCATDWSTHGDIFRDKRGIFYNCTFSLALGALREFDDDFGMIPYPKFDEAQEKYYSMSDGSHTISGVPKTITDPEFVGVAAEALCAEAWKQILPAMYEVALKTKFTRDSESIEMIDMINDNVIVDFGFVFADYNGMGFTLSNLMGSKKSDFASYYAKNSAKWEKQLAKVVASFEENG